MAKLDLKAGAFKKATLISHYAQLSGPLTCTRLRSHLRGEHGGAGPDAPAHHRFCDPALLDGLADLVLLRASDLCKAESGAVNQ